MTAGVIFALAGESFVARASGALWWPARGLLAVADLHLGKAERHARRSGILLPPYADGETVARLDAEIDALDPRMVIVVGDAFDDMAAMAALDSAIRSALERMMRARAWVWITGNHDPEPDRLGGDCTDEASIGPLVFRHIATDADAEISGHYHPKAILRARGRRVSRPCMAIDARRVILPAFGVYTGGLDITGPVLRPMMSADACAILTGRRARAVSLRDLEGAKPLVRHPGS